MADVTQDRRRIADTTAGILLEIGAILANTDEPFTFTSGSRSPVYVDIRKLIGYPRVDRRDRRRGDGRHSVCRMDRRTDGAAHGLCPQETQGVRADGSDRR
jgi:hypothetical protein